jgi:hypothetical protein
MKKLLLFFLLIAFLFVSFTSVSHFHNDTENGSKADCRLCVFAQTIPVMPSVHMVSIAPVIFREMTAPPTQAVLATSLFILPDSRAPPSVF